jgi:hypothetical protein
MGAHFTAPPKKESKIRNLTKISAVSFAPQVTLEKLVYFRLFYKKSMKLTHRFVRPSNFTASFCHALEGHAGEGSRRLDVEAVSVLLEELFLVVSGRVELV